jgi:hypothetical protein
MSVLFRGLWSAAAMILTVAMLLGAQTAVAASDVEPTGVPAAQVDDGSLLADDVGGVIGREEGDPDDVPPEGEGGGDPEPDSDDDA